jgi:DNA-binding GntR family transcriptional regulator
MEDVMGHQTDGQPHAGTEVSGESPRFAGTAVQNVKAQLREEIIRGDLRPGDALTSVQVAERFGVSRTPAREALRMLQEEGFLTGELNRRLRVVEWSADELEAVFAERIMLTVLCTRLTIPALTDADVERMQSLMQEMSAARGAEDYEAWRKADVAFHHMHMKGASETLRSDNARLYERASMFRAIWLRSRDQAFAFNMEDHPAILEACRQRDAEAGGLAAALHLTRVALTLMTELAPEREPAAVRLCLRLAGGGAPVTEPIPSGSRVRARNAS